MVYIKGMDRNQIILFSESIDDYISEDSPVRIIELMGSAHWKDSRVGGHIMYASWPWYWSLFYKEAT